MNILLNDEAIKLLVVRRLPGRLTVAQARILLGFNSIDLPVLITKRLLRPLGKPAPNAIKYFARRDIEHQQGASQQCQHPCQHNPADGYQLRRGSVLNGRGLLRAG